MNREDFVTKNEYVYLNSASTSYINKYSLEAMNDYYTKLGANAGRGIDSLGYEVTTKIEDTRKVVADYLGVVSEEVIFTRGTTDSLNLVARSFGELKIEENDEIIVSVAEHHSNFLPWQELAKRKKAKLIVLNLDQDQGVSLSELREKISDKTKIVAINHSSNVLGSINNLREISEIVHDSGAFLVVDGAQGILHEKINLRELNIDFYAFSAHKIYGPKGVGVLVGKRELLEQMEPLVYGGEMVLEVGNSTSKYKESPYKFEAGTMMIPEIIGMGVAIKYVEEIGIDEINKHIKRLRDYTLKEMKKRRSDLIIYSENDNSNLITFNVKDIHSHDVASYLDSNKIILRAGHHCCEPLMKYLNVSSTLRVSFGIYNTLEDCDKFLDVLERMDDYLNVFF